MLSKIEITIDFNGHGDQTLLFKYSKTEHVNLFQTSHSYFYYHCRIFAL